MNKAKSHECLNAKERRNSLQTNVAQGSVTDLFTTMKKMTDIKENTEQTEEPKFDVNNVTSLLNIDFSALLELDDSLFKDDKGAVDHAKKAQVQRKLITSLKIFSELTEGKNGRWYGDLKTVSKGKETYNSTHGITIWLKQGEEEAKADFEARIKKFNGDWYGNAKNYLFAPRPKVDKVTGKELNEIADALTS